MDHLLTQFEYFQSLGNTIQRSVYLILKEEILKGSLVGQISENSICKRLNISRTPVREAMTLLASDNLLTITHGRSAQINPITDDDVSDICAILRGLYIVSTELCIKKAQDEQFQKLEEIVALIKFYAERQNLEQTAYYNTQFHLAVCELADNRWMLRTMEDLMVYTYAHRRSVLDDAKRLSEVYDDHLYLLELIRRRDVSKVKGAIDKHIRGDEHLLIGLEKGDSNV